jgi:hypothetical protein
MSKHTPGPWVFTTERGDNVIRGGGKTLMNDTQYYPYCPDDDADWHLIASAPDLLQALRGMCSVWASVCNSRGWEPDHISEYSNARAAIARAKGETA